jgi:hypothetical protein
MFTASDWASPPVVLLKRQLDLVIKIRTWSKGLVPCSSSSVTLWIVEGDGSMTPRILNFASFTIKGNRTAIPNIRHV